MDKKKLSPVKIIDTFNKKQNCWYVHTDQYYWNSELKQTRHIRKTIGKRLTKDGDIIYNNTYLLEHPEEFAKKKSKNAVSNTKSLGEVKLLNTVVKRLKLHKFLQDSFGKDKANKIISLAEYLICTEKALSWSGAWAQDKELIIDDIKSQDVSKILESLTPDERNSFFKAWGEANSKGKKGYFCFDSTNISACNNTATPNLAYGYSHGHVRQNQVNLAILSRQDTFTPVQTLLYNGSRHDSTTISFLIEGLNKLDMNNIILTLDRGYYSKSNIETILKSHNSFIMPIPKRVNWQYDEIDSVKTGLNSVKASVEVADGNGTIRTIYCVRKAVIQDGRRLYLYVVYNPQVRSDHEIRFRELMRTCYKELLDNKLNENHLDYYDKYFSVSDTPKRGRKIIEKVSLEEEFNKQYAGYWCLLSNEKRERAEIYEAYSQRNTAEIFYDMVKNDLNGDRVRSHNNKTFEGKMFVTFIALIILADFKRKFAKVRSGNTTLNRVKSYKEVLFKMSSLTKVSFTGKYKPMYSRPTKFQEEIINQFNISWPV